MVLCLTLLATLDSALAGERVLRWIPPADNDVAGFVIYIGDQPGLTLANVTDVIDVGDLAPGSDGIVVALVEGIDTSIDSFAAVSAYDTSGNESDFSNEILLAADVCNLAACDDGNPCTVDQCDALGCLNPAAPDGLSCDDGDPGTVGDVCSAGLCTGLVPQCSVDSDCSDSDVCTGVERCVSNACVAGTALSCAALSGQCSTGTCDSLTGCQATPAREGLSCDDGDPGTVGDVCSAGLCAGQPALPPLQFGQLVSTLQSPAPVGSTIAFSATATGGSGSYEYRWWVRIDGGEWQIANDFSTATQFFVWTPQVAAGQQAEVAVWIRDPSVSLENVVGDSMSFDFSPDSSPAPQQPLQMGQLSASLASPQPVGTPVMFSASAIGGSGSYEYRWWVRPAGSPWRIARDYSPGASIVLTPGIADAPELEVAVWIRDTAGSVDEFVGDSMPFAVQAVSSLQMGQLTAGLSSPQPVGTSVSFTATATGGSGSYEYRWWVLSPGGPWQVVQDYSSGQTFSWTLRSFDSPQVQVAVWIRDPSVSLDDFVGDSMFFQTSGP